MKINITIPFDKEHIDRIRESIESIGYDASHTSDENLAAAVIHLCIEENFRNLEELDANLDNGMNEAIAEAISASVKTQAICFPVGAC